MSPRQGKPQQGKEDSVIAAKEFTLEKAKKALGLKIEELVQVAGQSESLTWRIQDIPETKDFVPTRFLGKSFKHSYSTVDPYLMVSLV